MSKDSRRGNGEGSITRRKDGLYMARVTVGRNLNGKLIRKTVYGKDKKELMAKMSKIQSEYFVGVFHEPTNMTLSTWLDTWLKTYKTIKLRVQTITLYKTLIRTIIKPRIGDVKLKQVKPMHIQELFNQLSKNGYSSSTQTKIKNILNPAFRVATINKMIPESPFIGIETAPYVKKEVFAFSRQEQSDFEETIVGDVFYNHFIFALDTGCRSGEMLCLTWDDIDFENEEVDINKTLITVEDEETHKVHLEVQDIPKTDSSIRKIPLTDRILDSLKELREKRLATGFKDNNIVFSTKVGTYIYPRNLRRALKRCCAKVGIICSGAHVLRHTYATRLFEEGIHIKVVSKLLGHARVEITMNIYTHLFSEITRETAKVLNNMKLTNNSINNSIKKNDETDPDLHQ